MQEDEFWSLLEQNRAWIEYHMFGAKGLDEIEDLKEGFLVEVGKLLIENGILVNKGFLVEMGFLED